MKDIVGIIDRIIQDIFPKGNARTSSDGKSVQLWMPDKKYSRAVSGEISFDKLMDMKKEKLKVYITEYCQNMARDLLTVSH